MSPGESNPSLQFQEGAQLSIFSSCYQRLGDGQGDLKGAGEELLVLWLFKNLLLEADL